VPVRDPSAGLGRPEAAASRGGGQGGWNDVLMRSLDDLVGEAAAADVERLKEAL
jgi:hypothetical protein